MPFGGRKTAPLVLKPPKVYEPTMEEFSDFLSFIEKIEREDKIHEIGICKIVPPKEWIPRKSGYNVEDLDYQIEVPLRQCFTQTDHKDCYITKSQPHLPVKIPEYYRMATSSQFMTPAHQDDDDLERKYWKSVKYVPPIYGCDVAHAISDPDLKIWNIAKLDSVLKYVSEDLETQISGVNTPYLYFGMWKATFSWHVEDMDLYGINMVHHGAPKTWYCVPPQYGHLLEKACKDIFPELSAYCSNFMRHKMCLVGPNVLTKYGIPYNKVVQREREIIIVFPYAYHSGFNHGYNIAESTNFATERWIEYGKRCRPCDCDTSRVKFNMDPFVKRFQPEKYEKWLLHQDIAPHPEDPPDRIKEIEIRAKDPVVFAREQEKKRFPEMTKFDNLSDDQTILDVFRHVDFNNLRVYRVPETKEFYKGKEELEAFLQKSNVDIGEFIEKGLLYKVDNIAEYKEEVIKLCPLYRAINKTEIQVERLTVDLYRHKTKPHIIIQVDPQTLTLVGDNDPQALEFIEFTGLSVKDLIESCRVFQKICTNIVEHTVTKQCYQRYKHSNTDVAYLINPKTFEFAPLHLQEDRAKEFIRKFGLKTQQNETIRKLMAAGALIEMTYDAQKYLHLKSGLNMYIDRNMIVGTREEVEEGMQLIGDRPIEDLIKDGSLIKVNPKLSITSNSAKPEVQKIKSEIPVKLENQPDTPTAVVPSQSVKPEPKMTILDHLPPNITKVKVINQRDYQSGNLDNAMTVSKSTLRQIRINFGSRKLPMDNEEDKPNVKRVKIENDTKVTKD